MNLFLLPTYTQNFLHFSVLFTSIQWHYNLQSSCLGKQSGESMCSNFIFLQKLRSLNFKLDTNHFYQYGTALYFNVNIYDEVKSNFVATDYKKWKIRWPPKKYRSHINSGDTFRKLPISETKHCHCHSNVCGLSTAVFLNLCETMAW